MALCPYYPGMSWSTRFILSAIASGFHYDLSAVTAYRGLLSPRYCLCRVIPLVSCFSGPCSFASIEEGLAIFSESCVFDSIVVFLNLMPIVQDSYFHLLRPLKGRDNFIVDKADLPGSCLRKMAKGIKYKMLVFSS